MQELIGHKIVKVSVSPDQNVLVFVDDENTWFVYETIGDCCSESWFADINGLHSLIGEVVAEVVERDVDGPDNDERSRQEYDEHYGIVLVTAKGATDIVYRNSSNGYYGGYCQFVGNKLAGEQYPLEEITVNDWRS